MNQQTDQDASLSEEEYLASLLPLLGRRVGAAEVRRTVVKNHPQLSANWEKFKQAMRPRDEVWSWAWQEMQADGRLSSSAGWCLLRDGKVVKSICWSFT